METCHHQQVARLSIIQFYWESQRSIHFAPGIALLMELAIPEPCGSIPLS